MNQKLIAAAVAAVMVAPVASYGQVEVTYNGKVGSFIDLQDPVDGDSTSDISTEGSRFGFNLSSDLGNGLVGHGKFEVGATSDHSGDDTGFGGTRHGYAGLRGSFGNFQVGQMGSAYYDRVGGAAGLDPNYQINAVRGNGIYVGGGSRTSNTIQYSNEFGPVTFAADIRTDDADDGQGSGFGFGITFNPTSNLTIGIGFDSEDGADTGAAGSLEVLGSYRDSDGFLVAQTGSGIKQFASTSDDERYVFEAELAIDVDGVDFEILAEDAGDTTFAVAAGGNPSTVTFNTDTATADDDIVIIVTGAGVDDGDGNLTYTTDPSDDEKAAAAANHIGPVAPTQDAPDSDVWGIGAKATFGTLFVAAGYQVRDIDEVDGIAASGFDANGDLIAAVAGEPSTANYGATGTGSIEETSYQLIVGGDISEKNSWNLGYSESTVEEDGKADVEEEGFALNLKHDAGGGLAFYFEYGDFSKEGDTTAAMNGDSQSTALGMVLTF